MASQLFSFNGTVQVYLQGPKALWMQSVPDSDELERVDYKIGSDSSPILVTDFRTEPNKAVQQAMQGRLEGDFADVFNVPASVTVNEEGQGVKIVLQDPEDRLIDETETPMLWMGVIEGDRIPAKKMFWRALKRVGENRTAFAILIP